MTRDELRILNAFPPLPKLIGAYELHQATGIASGTVAMAIRRLELAGLTESEWESPPPGDRPPRRLYRLSDAGLRERFERREVAGSGGAPQLLAADRVGPDPRSPGALEYLTAMVAPPTGA